MVRQAAGEGKEPLQRSHARNGEAHESHGLKESVSGFVEQGVGREV